MTNAELLAKIKAEIERRIEAHHTNGYFCAEHEFRDVLSFISDLEKIEKPNVPTIEVPIDGVLYAAACGIKNATGKSEKPMNQEGLEEEIERYLPKIPENPYNEELRIFARHFAEWGAEHLKK